MRSSQPAITSQKPVSRFYLPELDGLRFFAFILVFAHHQTLFSQLPVLSTIYEYGWVGVDLFFTLSAYLFTRQFILEMEKTNTIDVKRFYIRRIIRIWPLYFFAVFCAVALNFSDYGDLDDEKVVRVLGLFSFSDNIMTALWGYNLLPYIAHLWTITYEEQFYLLIPFVIMLLTRISPGKRMVVASTVFIVLQLIRIIFICNHASGNAIWVLPITHFDSVFMGVLAGFGGLDFLKRINSLLLFGAGVLVFWLICLLPNIYQASYWLILSYMLVGVFSALILISIINGNILKAFFSKKIIVFLGKRSYGLYVWSGLGIGVAEFIHLRFPSMPSGVLAFSIYSLVSTIILAVISYKFIETPFLKLKKKFEVISSRPV